MEGKCEAATSVVELSSDSDCDFPLKKRKLSVNRRSFSSDEDSLPEVRIKSRELLKPNEVELQA